MSAAWFQVDFALGADLTHLWTVGHSIEPLLLFVLKDEDASSRDGQPVWPCEVEGFKDLAPALPHLSALVVENADFEWVVETDTRGASTLSQVFHTAIARCLHLKELRLPGCTNVPNDIEDVLAHLVPSVVIEPKSIAASHKAGSADATADEFMYPQDDIPDWFRLLSEPY